MTNATKALAELAEKGADVDMLRQMVQFAARRLMEMEAETLCGAGYDEKNPECINNRNGYRKRAWETRAGGVEMRVPKLRQGKPLPGLPGAPAHGREDAGRGHPGGIGARRVHLLGCLSCTPLIGHPKLVPDGASPLQAPLPSAPAYRRPSRATSGVNTHYAARWS